ncbi:ROK family protein [Oceanirhabdus sp. W0125-5]|uniref:ROK family protein n=1 Tax=Oceanirhabdus sp. W0125-5 TaxID=2999116 RepID=UPI0022F321FD|nr:ROK family glucokinase [Oceanirhabdus sp. W0125-5]WBW95647.1 ROK family glucokinase [Oceanirhabdus sp. W0125-5]
MYIGVDLGGTNIAVGIVDNFGKIHYQKSIPTGAHRKSDEVIEDIINLIIQVIDEYGLNKEHIKAIGIGIPGLSEPITGNVIQCVNLNWSKIPLKRIMERILNIPVFVDNDATLAGLAEFEIGSMKGKNNGVFITLGTGIGGGIIIDGKIHTGVNGIGSEIGHMVVGKNYYDCNCGRNGCLETFSSATALINYTKKLMEEEEYETLITEKINGDLNNLNGKMIFHAAIREDKLANKAVDRLVKYLAIGIINIASVIDPEIFVIGGGLSKAGVFLLDKVRAEVLKNKFIKNLPVGKIALAELGNEAGIIGAAMLGKHNKF